MNKSDFSQSSQPEEKRIDNDIEISGLAADDGGESEELGERIRELRQYRNLTIRELAMRAEISVNSLSMIENGKSSPSVNTLRQIARALQVPMTRFFQPVKDEKSIVFTRATDHPKAMTKVALMEYLSKDLTGNIVDALVITAHPNMNSGKVPIIHAGYEFVYCLSGKILYSIGNEHFLLEPGDSVAFEASQNHQWQNLEAGVSQYLLVMINSCSSCVPEMNTLSIHNFLPDGAQD